MKRAVAVTAAILLVVLLAFVLFKLPVVMSGVTPLVVLLYFVAPWVIGFGYVLADANGRGQPGWLWALLTIPLGWVAVLAYAVVRALTSPRP